MRKHIGLFHGKRKDNGEWVEGYLHVSRYKADAFCISFYPVYPDTIGECCGGLRDKNGKLIFEHHVLRYGKNIGYVNYGTGCFCVKSCTPDWRNRNNPAIDIILNEYPNDVEIIGELEDYPELKGGEEE